MKSGTGRETNNQFSLWFNFFFLQNDGERKKTNKPHPVRREQEEQDEKKERAFGSPPPQTAEFKLNLHEVCVWRRRDKLGGKVEKDREKKMTLTQPTWNIFWRKTQKLKIIWKCFARKHKKKTSQTRWHLKIGTLPRLYNFSFSLSFFLLTLKDRHT